MEQLSAEDRQILLAAKELLSEEERWTRWAHARNAQGYPVKPRDPTAVCWCTYGAIAHFSPDGLIPYSILRHLDACILQYDPGHAVLLEWTVDTIQDEVFTHDLLLGFFDYLIGQSGG